MPKCQIHACAEKVRNTTLDDERYNCCKVGAGYIDRPCVLVTALCNQPEAFASDLDDDQSHYLYYKARVSVRVCGVRDNAAVVIHSVLADR